MPPSRPTLGVLLMAGASVGFVGMASMVRLMDQALPEPHLVFWRAVFSLPVLLVIVLRARHALVVRARWTLLLRSVSGFGAMLLFFYALGRLSVAEASMLAKVQPVWIALAAPALVGDRPGPRIWGCMAASLVGVGLVLGPDLTLGIISLGGLAALGSSLLSALAHLQVRKLGATETPDVVVLNFTFLLLLLSGLASIPGARVPEASHWPLLVALALCAMLGQILMTAAYRAAPAPLVATVGYLSIPGASLIDWLIWDELPSVPVAIGGLLIIAAGVALATRGAGGGRARVRPDES